MRRTWIYLLLVPATCLVLLAGCGGGRASTAADPRASSEPTRTPPPSHRSPAPNEVSSWEDFPLDLGYPAKNGNDGSQVEIRPQPASRAFRLCGHTTWDPRDGTTGVLGVRYRGEAEYERGRTLVRYPNPGAAGRAVSRAREALAACPDEPGQHDQGTTHTPVDRAQGEPPLGDESVVWTDTFYTVSGGQQVHDTGLVVYELVRVGRTVLLAYQYDEGNGSPESREQAVAGFTRHEHAVVERMGGLRPARSGSRA